VLTADDRAEIDELLGVIAVSPLQANDCVCHGEFGTVDTLISVSAFLAEPSWLHLARRRLSAALARRTRNGHWRGGIKRQEDVPDPGFMMGLSGIGFGLLRAVNPDIPSLVAVLGHAPTVAAKRIGAHAGAM
jgi:lantibiotic modifying enzyme